MRLGILGAVGLLALAAWSRAASEAVSGAGRPSSDGTTDAAGEPRHVAATATFRRGPDLSTPQRLDPAVCAPPSGGAGRSLAA